LNDRFSRIDSDLALIKAFDVASAHNRDDPPDHLLDPVLAGDHRPSLGGATLNRRWKSDPGTTSSESKAAWGSFSRYRPHMARNIKLDHIPPVSVRWSTTGAEVRRSQRMGVYDIYEWQVGDIQNRRAWAHPSAGGTARGIVG